jgi:predicted nucleotide-binding protein (sugar kinase/HSP70/actin superfamily)
MPVVSPNMGRRNTEKEQMNKEQGTRNTEVCFPIHLFLVHLFLVHLFKKAGVDTPA